MIQDGQIRMVKEVKPIPGNNDIVKVAVMSFVCVSGLMKKGEQCILICNKDKTYSISPIPNTKKTDGRMTIKDKLGSKISSYLIKDMDVPSELLAALKHEINQERKFKIQNKKIYG
jgi:hypothetical protein